MLHIYVKRTIRPPKKIRNVIKANTDKLDFANMMTHSMIVIAKMVITLITGEEEKTKILLAPLKINATIQALINS